MNNPQKFPKLFLACIAFILLGLALAYLRTSADEAQLLSNGSFESGLEAWEVHSNPDAFLADCTYNMGDAVEGQCLLQSGLRKGTNRLVQIVDTSNCAEPRLFWSWQYYNGGTNPSTWPTYTFIEVNGEAIFQIWNYQANYTWRQESVPLPVGLVEVAIGSFVYDFRLDMSYAEYDNLSVSCVLRGPIVSRQYLPLVLVNREGQ